MGGVDAGGVGATGDCCSWRLRASSCTRRTCSTVSSSSRLQCRYRNCDETAGCGGSLQTTELTRDITSSKATTTTGLKSGGCSNKLGHAVDFCFHCYTLLHFTPTYRSFSCSLLACFSCLSLSSFSLAARLNCSKLSLEERTEEAGVDWDF